MVASHKHYEANETAVVKCYPVLLGVNSADEPAVVDDHPVLLGLEGNHVAAGQNPRINQRPLESNLIEAAYTAHSRVHLSLQTLVPGSDSSMQICWSNYRK